MSIQFTIQVFNWGSIVLHAEHVGNSIQYLSLSRELLRDKALAVYIINGSYPILFFNFERWINCVNVNEYLILYFENALKILLRNWFWRWSKQLVFEYSLGREKELTSKEGMNTTFYLVVHIFLLQKTCRKLQLFRFFLSELEAQQE